MVFLNFLKLTDVVWESSHHGLDPRRNRRGTELGYRETSRVAVGLKRLRLDGNFRVLLIIVSGLLGFAPAAR